MTIPQDPSNRAPRITMLNRLFWPRRFGGLERVLWRFANALADTGVEIQVIAEAVDGAPAQETARPGLAVRRHDPVDVGRLWRIGELVQVRWWQQALRQAPPADIIWANEPTAAVAAIRMGLADRLLYRPVFCYAGLHRSATTHPEMAPLRRTPLSRLLDRYAYRRAGRVIQESHNLRRQHERWYGRRPSTWVIPNPADAPTITASPRERLGLDPQHFVIGFVGRPGDPCKDLPFLLQALRKQAMPEHARLLIVGGGVGLDDARRWVEQAGLGSRTLWTGDLADPGPAYAAMDALVLPSRFETFGNVIVEAHAHGLPALGRGSDVTADKPVFTASDELIDNGVTGFVVDPQDPAELGAKLLLLAMNPTFTNDMGRAAKLRSQSYTWADAADRYLDALEIGIYLENAGETKRLAA